MEGRREGGREGRRKKRREGGEEGWRVRERGEEKRFYAPKSGYLPGIPPVEVSELVALPGKGQQGVRPQPHLPIHAGGEVDTEEWESGIRNLGMGEWSGEGGMWKRRESVRQKLTSTGREAGRQSETERRMNRGTSGQTDRQTQRDRRTHRVNVALHKVCLFRLQQEVLSPEGHYPGAGAAPGQLGHAVRVETTARDDMPRGDHLLQGGRGECVLNVEGVCAYPSPSPFHLPESLCECHGNLVSENTCP